MYSRLSLRGLRSTRGAANASQRRTASESFSPVDVATEMRLQGPTRVQDHDFLHVFEDTVKPAISGPLAIGLSKN